MIKKYSQDVILNHPSLANKRQMCIRDRYSTTHIIFTSMLEQIIIRKPFLKKQLAAPLLKELESFLTMKSKEGLSRLTLMGWAGYSLKFIQYFNLHEDVYKRQGENTYFTKITPSNKYPFY